MSGEIPPALRGGMMGRDSALVAHAVATGCASVRSWMRSAGPLERGEGCASKI